MKKIIVSIMTSVMFTTGAALVILAFFCKIIGRGYIQENVVLEIFGANIFICFGIFIRSRFDVLNIIVELLIDVSYTIIVLIMFGIFFHWFLVIPIWLLVSMAIGINILIKIICIVKISKDKKEINELLQKRKEKNQFFAS